MHDPHKAHIKAKSYNPKVTKYRSRTISDVISRYTTTQPTFHLHSIDGYIVCAYLTLSMSLT